MPTKLVLVSLIIVVSFVASASGTASATTASTISTCPPYQLKAPPNNVGLDVIGIDVSGSTRGGQLASLYEAAADGAIDTAAKQHLGVVVQAFTDATSSSTLIFADSFAGSTGNSVLDLANANRVNCQAKRAVHDLLKVRSRTANTGTDVGGNLAALVSRARVATTSGRPAEVLDLTDGWTEPARSGSGGHSLIDLRRLIDSGRSLAQIYGEHRSSFDIGKANGVTISVRGIDRQSNGALASTAHAKALVQLWTRACHDAHAKTCDVSEEVP